MKETRFISQNKEKWQESENLLKDSYKDPEKLSNLFTQVVDDLSYSRTYYPNRSVRVYLNKIAREYFSIIYSHQKEKKNTFKLFWLNELPQIVFFARKQILISFLIFLFSACIGIFSSIKDPQFTSSILGESYVTMTKENIEKGDPMAVYKKGHQVDMFLGITFNNLMVAFRTYVFGLFLSIGTVAILLYNGIMVGCFQFFFIERGLFAESALTIWLHGTLEISSIILAGGAGLTLGSGLIFPGTYSRLQAFQISGIRSLKLMLGITPIFVLAAIIESFLTRYTEVPDFFRLLLIILSAIFIIGYFGVYPWLKSKKGFDQPLAEARLQPNTNDKIQYDRIKNGAEIVKDTFIFYKKHLNSFLTWTSVVTLFMALAEFLSPFERTTMRYFENPFYWLFNDLFYAVKTPFPIFILINGFGTSLIVYRTFMLMDADSKKIKAKTVVWKTLIQTILVITAMYGILYWLEGWGALFMILGFGITLLLAFTQLTKNTNLITGIYEGWELVRSNFGQIMGTQFILLLMAFSFLVVLSAPILYMNTTVLQWNFAESDVWSKNIIRFIELFIKIFAFNLILPILAASIGGLFFSLQEIVSAEHLKKSIATVGLKIQRKGKK